MFEQVGISRAQSWLSAVVRRPLLQTRTPEFAGPKRVRLRRYLPARCYRTKVNKTSISATLSSARCLQGGVKRAGLICWTWRCSVSEPTDRANGLTRDLQGRLLACEHDSRRVTRKEVDGSITVLANSFQGRRLNRPNDVVVKSDGSIYFTDPWSSPLAREQWDLTFSGVYRLSPDLGTLTLLLDDMVFPNGLAFSPDESVLYISDFRRGHIRAFDMAPNGTLARQTDRVFVDLTGPEPGGPDGMRVDTAGNVYSGGSGGIYIIDPKGKKLGRIVHGRPETTNIAFGGDDWKTLYFTNWYYLGAVKVKIPGIPVPTPKKS